MSRRSYFLAVAAAFGALEGCVGQPAPLPSSTQSIVSMLNEGGPTGLAAGKPQVVIAFRNLTGQAKLLVFASSASGNVAPIVRLPFATLFGVTSSGDFLSGGSSSTPQLGLYSASSGKLTEPIVFANQNVTEPYGVDTKGNIYTPIGQQGPGGDCEFVGVVRLQEYAAGSRGKKVLRTISLGAACTIGSGAFGGGNVFVAKARTSGLGVTTAQSIAAFAPTASGPNPSWRIGIKNNQCGQVFKIAADRAGNLFVGCESSGIYEYPSGKAPGRMIWPHSWPFAIDSRDNLYLVESKKVQDKQNPCGVAFQYSIEALSPGSKAPFKTISGPATSLATACANADVSIAVVP